MTANAQVVVTHDKDKVSSGYVFYAPSALEKSFLIANDGEIVHSWPGSGPAGQAVKLLPDGTLLRSGAIYTSVFFEGKGAGGQVEKRAWDGKLLWKYTLPKPEMYLQHHDVEALPNGNILMVTWELRTREEAIAAGRDPATVPERGLWSEAIFEVRPDPPEGGTIVWEWHVWDHLVQDTDPAKPNFGNVAASPGRFDINFNGSNADLAHTSDWLHVNAVSYNAKLDQIVLSSRPWSEIWIIDHSTTTEEAASARGGKYRRGGELLYRWGNPQAYRAGTRADQTLFNQHDPQWIADGLPGAGHLLVFNNGVGRGYSSADEIALPVDASGAYTLGPNGRYGPAAPFWTSGPDISPAIFSLIAGGVERLPNGNTLFCLSNANRLVEVTPEKEIAWELNLGAGEFGGFTFRANRFTPSAPQLAETTLALPAPALWNAASMAVAPLAPGALAGASAATAIAAAKVTDATGAVRDAVVQAVSPTEIRFQVPRQSAVGPARLTVTGAAGASQSRDFRIATTAPGLFSANGDGKGAGAVIAIGAGPFGPTFRVGYELDPVTKRNVPVAIPLVGAVYLSLYGTGLPSSAGLPAVTIGGVPVPVASLTALPEFPGIDQLNIGPLPAALAGRKHQPIVVVHGGASSNPVDVSFQ